MEQEQNLRDRYSIREFIPDWRPTREQVLWAVWITILLAVLLGILTLVSLPFDITLWQWVKLLIIPAVIAGGGIWFNRQQQQRQLEIAERRAQDEALQAYLDRMGNLLLDKDKPAQQPGVSAQVGSQVHAHTFTILRR